jgi:hypothetical protein
MIKGTSMFAGATLSKRLDEIETILGLVSDDPYIEHLKKAARFS